MFGISFVELTIVLLVAIFIVRPKDAPQIARSIGKYYAKAKSYFDEFKANIDKAKSDTGFAEVKESFDKAVNEVESHKAEQEQQITKIVDLYGKTHYVADINSIRPDLDEEELQSEVLQENKKNSQSEEK